MVPSVRALLPELAVKHLEPWNPGHARAAAVGGAEACIQLRRIRPGRAQAGPATRRPVGNGPALHPDRQAGPHHPGPNRAGPGPSRPVRAPGHWLTRGSRGLTGAGEALVNDPPPEHRLDSRAGGRRTGRLHWEEERDARAKHRTPGRPASGLGLPGDTDRAGLDGDGPAPLGGGAGREGQTPHAGRIDADRRRPWMKRRTPPRTWVRRRFRKHPVQRACWGTVTAASGRSGPKPALMRWKIRPEAGPAGLDGPGRPRRARPAASTAHGARALAASAGHSPAGRLGPGWCRAGLQGPALAGRLRTGPPKDLQHRILLFGV
jgi:hypothetical protein